MKGKHFSLVTEKRRNACKRCYRNLLSFWEGDIVTLWNLTEKESREKAGNTLVGSQNSSESFKIFVHAHVRGISGNKNQSVIKSSHFLVIKLQKWSYFTCLVQVAKRRVRVNGSRVLDSSKDVMDDTFRVFSKSSVRKSRKDKRSQFAVWTSCRGRCFHNFGRYLSKCIVSVSLFGVFTKWLASHNHQMIKKDFMTCPLQR